MTTSRSENLSNCYCVLGALQLPGFVRWITQSLADSPATKYQSGCNYAETCRKLPSALLIAQRARRRNISRQAVSESLLCVFIQRLCSNFVFFSFFNSKRGRKSGLSPTDLEYQLQNVIDGLWYSDINATQPRASAQRMYSSTLHPDPVCWLGRACR